ncbi:MAG: alpha/beta fold hydrolase, partial [Alphaproteobacteria bacterium]
VALAKTLGHRKFCLVGHDWGGIVAWQVAATFPEYVEQLAILNAPRFGAFGRFAWLHPTQLFKAPTWGFSKFQTFPKQP